MEYSKREKKEEYFNLSIC